MTRDELIREAVYRLLEPDVTVELTVRSANLLTEPLTIPVTVIRAIQDQDVLVVGGPGHFEGMPGKRSAEVTVALR